MCVYAVRIQPNLKPVLAWVHPYALPTLVWLKDDGVKEVLVFFDLGLISSEHSCKTKAPYFKCAIKMTCWPKRMIKLAWHSARMLNCNEMCPFTVIKFVHGIQFCRNKPISGRKTKKKNNCTMKLLWNFFAKTKKMLVAFQSPEVSHNFQMSSFF